MRWRSYWWACAASHSSAAASTIGGGRALVDLFDDAVTLLAPVDPGEVRRALAQLRVGRVIAGHRSRPAGDLAAATEAICRLVAVVLDDPGIVELEVNPLLVLADGVRRRRAAAGGE